MFEAVISPLVILCGQIPEDSSLSQDDLWDIFDDLLIEEDVLPLLQMAMYVPVLPQFFICLLNCRSLGLTSSVEKMDPEMFDVARRRGSVLSGKES